jgi:membrane protein DedA with SNARE-associated domain
MLEFAIRMLEQSAQVLSPPWFTFFGTMLEEVIAPIPSPIVMTLGGSLAASQHRSVWYLLLLALTGTAGKIIGSYVIYVIADKFENIITGRFGRVIGLTHEQIEAVGRRFGKGQRDTVVLFLLRALPFVPTAPVSFAAGLLRLDLKTYLLSSAAGIFIRNIFFLYVGFTSVGALEKINENLASSESIGSMLLLVGVAAVALYFYIKRKKFWQEEKP